MPLPKLILLSILTTLIVIYIPPWLCPIVGIAALLFLTVIILEVS